jgi:S-adenosylmethionine decarboxylase
MKTQNFGEHFMLDGYYGSKAKLNDKELVLNCINDLVTKLGMSKLAEPTILFAPGNNEKDPGGWSGFVVINESHISIHTFPERGFVSVDAYTCKNGMNTDLIKNCITETFELKETETNFVKRGTKYPVENLI